MEKKEKVVVHKKIEEENKAKLKKLKELTKQVNGMGTQINNLY